LLNKSMFTAPNFGVPPKCNLEPYDEGL